jgi:hypothetical protein
VQGGVRAMEVIVVKIGIEERGSMVAGEIRARVSPLASDGLDEAFGLAIGLRAIGFSEEMGEAELAAGGGEEVGAVGGAAICEETLDGDVVSGEEVESLLESGEDAWESFVWEETGEGEAGVVIDGDVEGLDAGAWIAHEAIAGGADARAREAAQLLDVEVEEVARVSAFVAHGGRFWRFEREDLGFEGRGSLARLAKRSRRTLAETRGKTLCFCASEPDADGLFADTEGGGRVSKRTSQLDMLASHLGSRERGQSGISVHVVRMGRPWVECSSTTSLSRPFPADNVLKHDT